MPNIPLFISIYKYNVKFIFDATGLLVTDKYSIVKWVHSCRYLWTFFVCGRTFKCSLSNAESLFFERSMFNLAKLVGLPEYTVLTSLRSGTIAENVHYLIQKHHSNCSIYLMRLTVLLKEHVCLGRLVMNIVH